MPILRDLSLFRTVSKAIYDLRCLRLGSISDRTASGTAAAATASASVNGRTGVLYARKFDQNAQN